jgi:hypothetical protein
MLRLFAAIIGALGASGVAHSGPLFDAAARGDVAAVEKLLGEGVEVDQRGRNAETPLIAAALAGETATAESLIVRGADVMARNKGGLTPLHAAAYSGSAEVARLLLDHGADLEDRANVSGATPLILAAEERRRQVLALFGNARRCIIHARGHGGEPIHPLPGPAGILAQDPVEPVEQHLGVVAAEGQRRADL